MSNIRLRLDLAGIGLEFSGSHEFYLRWVEPIVKATCQRDPSAGVAAEPALESEPDPAMLDVSKDAASGGDPMSLLENVAVFQPENPARFQQFVAQVGDRAATTEQQVMAFGFYLWNYEKRNAFGWDDMEGFFGMLRQDVPEDLGDMIGNLSDRKRFLEADEADPRHWKLTTKGVNYVKNRLLGSV